MDTKIRLVLTLLTMVVSGVMAQESWTQKVTLAAGGARYGAVGIRDKGYMGLGLDDAGNYHQNFLAYHSPTDFQINKIVFPGAGRTSAAIFNTSSKEYLGLGMNNSKGSATNILKFSLEIREVENTPVVTIDPVMVTTFAGGAPGSADGTGTSAQLFNPQGLAVDANGNVYVADTGNSRIRKITPEGVVTTFAGSVEGHVDGMGTTAQFLFPTSLCFDASGNMYVIDTGNSCIRKITPGGFVTTFVGASAGFDLPLGIAADPSGNLYVADQGNNRILKIDPSGLVSTLVGNGIPGNTDGPAASAQVSFPRGVAVDESANVYVGDFGNHRIRKISATGMVTTLAGSTDGYQDGPGTSAQFSYPWGVAVASGNIYVADQGNLRIRKIDPTGMVTTVAGSGVEGDADGASTFAQFRYPVGVAVDASGNVYVADAVNNRIRKISKPMFTSFATILGTASASQSFSVSGAYLADNAIVTAPGGYEISFSASSGFTSSLSLSPSSGVVTSRIIFIRLKADNPFGVYEGEVNLTSAGAVTQTLTVRGTVNCTDAILFVTPLQLFCFSPTNQYGLLPLFVTDPCGTPKITYTISGATTRSGTGTQASGFFRPGRSKVTWTIISSSGKVFTQESIIIVQRKMTVAIGNQYAVIPGGKPNTIYTGYGPSSLTFTARASGGEPYPGNTYRYSWSTGETTRSLTVSPATPGTYSYSVKVTDMIGFCEVTASVTVKVIDVRCGDQQQKILVCLASGRPCSNTFCLDKRALPYFFRRGATLGTCSCGFNTQEYRVDALADDEEDISVYPNPSAGSFTLRWTNLTSSTVRIQIIDQLGNETVSQSVACTDEVQSLPIEMPASANGVYIIKIVSDIGTKAKKIVVQK
ncbi:T9SS type A sorting domain-containing protein [Chryseolinea soli]|uniref:T9SS C-terminal target domain-containing protein n=1 Tax=Chryseolinea soli TaxID=2321403 RepID=A0A385SI52_9BACT|nr:T9SS type A sorting domain-containing protein [Chryseolinea soli]AYB30146.1 T9SS C-terminal target domain-containing protein [Chryseolinea soli]